MINNYGATQVLHQPISIRCLTLPGELAHNDNYLQRYGLYHQIIVCILAPIWSKQGNVIKTPKACKE